jgi:hypothetical protein
MAKFYYLDNAILEAVLNAIAYSSPSSIVVALFTTAPGPTGLSSGVEVSGGSYARTACTFGSPTNGSLSNNASCTFPQATAPWGTVVAFALVDNSGNPLYYGNLTASKTINTGDQLTFASGGLTVTES